MCEDRWIVAAPGSDRLVSNHSASSVCISTCLGYCVLMLHHIRCLAHVVNLAIVDFMSHITKIAAIENATAIWEYDPSLEGNRVLGGSLDVIAAIRTLAIKVSLVIAFFQLIY